VKNEEVLLRVKMDKNVLHTIKRTKVTWIDDTLCRNFFIKHVAEGNTEEG
jgi:hypothetical protein